MQRVYDISYRSSNGCLVPRRLSLVAKVVGAQGRKGRRKEARRLAENAFKMAKGSTANDYAIFKKEHRPALIFFRLLLSSCLNWKIYCDDPSSLPCLVKKVKFHYDVFSRD